VGSPGSQNAGAPRATRPGVRVAFTNNSS
jgi:hypothetical protein